MAAASRHPRLNVRPDDLFFSGMAAVALAAVLVGFARTYFLAGLFRAPWSTLLLVSVQQGRHLLGQTAAWQSFATWVQLHMPAFS